MDYSKEQYYRMQQMLANQAYKADGCAGKKPFYMEYPVQSLYMTELEYEKDMERMKEMYPSEARQIQEYVEDECDRMEYDGSLMFDEYPDRLMLSRICDRIYDKVVGSSEDMEAEEEQGAETAEVIEQQRRRGGRREPADRRDHRDGRRNLVEVLLFNEMFKRRCRYRRCRRWW